jgi:hypothetical protein
MNLIMFSDFVQTVNNIREHPTKNDYFSTHIQFTTIYLLDRHKLNLGNYSKQEIIMINFVQDIEHEVYMYANFEYSNIYVFLIKYFNI